jgi:hypothetical protein
MHEQSEIEYRRTPEYIHAIVSGPRTREFVSQFFRELPEKCTQLGYRRLMIELRLAGEPLNVSTIFDLVRQFIAEIKRQPDPISMVAFVGSYHDIPSLAEIASANRAVQIGGFTEFAAAESWLLGTTSSGDPEGRHGS